MEQYYVENSMLGLQTVTTYNGGTEYRTNCRKIKHQFYIKDIDCFLIDNRWYRLVSGLIEFNHTTKKYFLKDKKPANIMKGIVSYEDKKPVFGFFENNPYETVQVKYNGNIYPCINEQVANLFAKEYIAMGYFVENSSWHSSFSTIRNLVNNQVNDYNIDDNATKFLHQIGLYDGYNPKIPKAVAKYSRYLGERTFGLEYECIRGYVREDIRNKYGVVICRDGSLKDEDNTQGPEYTTVPYNGAKGVQSIIEFNREICKRNIINRNCAFHIHIGNFDVSKSVIVCLYKLAYMIQDELFKMFPTYKLDEVRYMGKQKNYCQKLDKLFELKNECKSKECYSNFINDNYLRIYRFLLENGQFPSKNYNRKNRKHPKQHKWDRHARYYWLNFINLITSKRNTVEFRLHTPTMNAQKSITWLFMCNAILGTAINNQKDILEAETFSLDKVFDYYKDTFRTSASNTLSNYLKFYYQNRVECFEEDSKRGDFVSMKELLSDSSFSLQYSFISEMFK